MLELTIAMASCTSCGRLAGTGHTSFCPFANDLLRREAEAEVAKAVREGRKPCCFCGFFYGHGDSCKITEIERRLSSRPALPPSNPVSVHLSGSAPVSASAAAKSAEHDASPAMHQSFHHSDRANNFASTAVSSLSGYGTAGLEHFESQARGFQHDHLLKARGEAELYSLLDTSKTNGRSLETVVPAAIVQDDQSLEPAVPELSTGSNMDIEVAEPVTASIQAANSTDADAAIATNDVAAATPSDADEDLLDDDDPLMDADSDELCDICENCGHRPAAWELGGQECWECFREH